MLLPTVLAEFFKLTKNKAFLTHVFLITILNFLIAFALSYWVSLESAFTDNYQNTILYFYYLASAYVTVPILLILPFLLISFDEKNGINKQSIELFISPSLYFWAKILVYFLVFFIIISVNLLVGTLTIYLSTYLQFGNIVKQELYVTAFYSYLPIFVIYTITQNSIAIVLSHLFKNIGFYFSSILILHFLSFIVTTKNPLNYLFLLINVINRKIRTIPSEVFEPNYLILFGTTLIFSISLLIIYTYSIVQSHEKYN